MAEVDTLMLTEQHSDIRREAVEHTNEIVKEGLKGQYAAVAAVNAATADLSKQVDAIDDTLTEKFFVLSRESADNRAQITALGFQVRDGFTAAAKDSEINGLKTQIEMQKQST
jgi:hypothetical protein